MRKALLASTLVLSALLGFSISARALSFNWSFTQLDYPGADWTVATGVDGQRVVGYAHFTSHPVPLPWDFSIDAFVYDLVSDTWSKFAVPHSCGFFGGTPFTEAEDVDGNTVIGRYGCQGDPAVHGFVYDMASATSQTLDYPGASATSVWGIRGNYVVGDFKDSSSNTHGFVYDLVNHNWQVLTYPGATTTIAKDVYGNYVVGHVVDDLGIALGFVYDMVADEWRYLPYPAASIFGDYVVGSAPAGSVDEGAGYVYDLATGEWFFFRWNGHALGVHGFDGATVVGHFGDWATLNIHGFVGVNAPPVPEPSTLLLMGTGLLGLAAWARGKVGS